MGLPGLQRECLRSGTEWDATVRRFEDEAFAALGRACGRAKVLREILRYLGRDVAVADVRAVSSIARRLRVTVRNVRQHLAALEAAGWIVRVHKAGLRFPGQRGWATSAYVVPALLPAVALMPPGRRDKARELLVPALGHPQRDPESALGSGERLGRVRRGARVRLCAAGRVEGAVRTLDQRGAAMRKRAANPPRRCAWGAARGRAALQGSAQAHLAPPLSAFRHLTIDTHRRWRQLRAGAP